MSEKNTGKLDGVMSKGYGIIPKMVMKDQELTIEAKAIYAYLASYTGNGHTAYPSVKLMCHDLGISRDRFYRHRNKLIERGYVTVKQSQDGDGWKNNVYTIEVLPRPYFTDTRNADTQNTDTQNKATNNNSSNNNSTNNNKDNNSRTNVHQDSDKRPDKYPPEIEKKTDKSTSGKPSEVVVDKIPYKKIIDYLNEQSGKNFRNVEGNKKLIRARWNEGYREDDFYQVIDNMTARWKGKTFSSGEPGENYLRPRTLFQQSKFDEYLNETVSEAKKENASDVFNEVF